MTKKATSTDNNHLLKWFELFNEIGIINQLASTRFERQLPHGLTLSQFSVLNNFARLGGTRTPVQLAKAFQVTKGAMTNTLKKLSSKELVTISADPDDGRSKCVEITAKGLMAREQAINAAMLSLADLQELLTAEMVVEMLPHLQALRQILDAARDHEG
jgi:DNA-binding MarR family transcriptional regulator